MSELDKTLEKINGQLKEILDRIDQINGSLREMRSSLIEQIIAEFKKA